MFANSMLHCLSARLALVASVLCLGIPGAVAAQAQSDDATRAVARDLGTQGIDAYRADNFADADAKLERAYRLFAAPTVGLWSARARVKLGRLVEGAERYREAMRNSAALGDNEAQKQAQADAAAELKELLPRIPTLTIKLESPELAELRVMLDGVALPRELLGMARPTNPGSHSVIAEQGSERFDRTVQLEERDSKVLPLQFRGGQGSPADSAQAKPDLSVSPVLTTEQSTTSAPASALKPVAAIALGLAALGLTTWAVGALLADGKLDNCPQENGIGRRLCDTQDQADSYTTWKTLSTIGFYSGLGFAAVGVGTWLYADLSQEKQTAGLRLNLGPSGATLRGRF